jgi:hypothetical protein
MPDSKKPRELAPIPYHLDQNWRGGHKRMKSRVRSSRKRTVGRDRGSKDEHRGLLPSLEIGWIGSGRRLLSLVWSPSASQSRCNLWHSSCASTGFPFFPLPCGNSVQSPKMDGPDHLPQVYPWNAFFLRKIVWVSDFFLTLLDKWLFQNAFSVILANRLNKQNLFYFLK